MRRQEFGLKYVLVLIFVLAIAPISFMAAGEEPPVSKVAETVLKPILVTPEELEILIEKRDDEAILPHIPPEERERARAKISFLRHSKYMNTRDGRINQNGCYASFGIYHKPLFILGDQEDQISFLELIKRAEVAVIAKVLSAQSGIVNGSGGTLVHLEPIENVKDTPLPEGREWYYRSLEYSFEVNGELFCHQRDGFYRERPGDIVLFVARFGRPTPVILPYGVFEVRNGLIMPQSYEFLLPFEPVDISEVRAYLH